MRRFNGRVLADRCVAPFETRQTGRIGRGGTMRKFFALCAAIALASSAFAAPNVTNVTQKGSLLIWPDIRIDDGWNTLIRLQNDGSQDVDVVCYWLDGNKHRVDFVFTITRNQAI